MFPRLLAANCQQQIYLSGKPFLPACFRYLYLYIACWVVHDTEAGKERNRNPVRAREKYCNPTKV